MQFYPENPAITINPLQGSGELRYILSSSQGKLSQKDITLKYAFAGKWKISSAALKSRIRDILVHILDIGHFEIQYSKEKILLSVPLRALKNTSLLPNMDKIEIPVVIKLQKKEGDEALGFQLKCYQTIYMVIPQESREKETEEEEESYLSLPVADGTKSSPDESQSALSPTEEGSLLSAQEKLPSEKNSALDLALPDLEKAIEDAFHAPSQEAPDPLRLYNGIMAIDFGTTNSVVVVRDPLYAAEQIKEDLSKEQWNTLIKWMDSWIAQHLSGSTPTNEDLYLEELTRCVPEMNLPACGSPTVEIWEELHKMDPHLKAKFLMEAFAGFSLFDETRDPPNILRSLASELLVGMEQSIYSKTLESQRYFILELDPNVGVGPISSAIQILSAPHSDDQKRLGSETKIEMGVRVHLLMRSAALGEADIRQFALTVKRYFGEEQAISLLPSESSLAPISYSPDTLCRLAYQKLISLALNNIKQRARQGEFQSADHIYTLVATFPTTYPASLRRRLRDMMNDLGIGDIDTRFDEGTASALYYIWRDVCADPICGMHGLMARCRFDRHGRAYQNMLLYDLGGGTTDIALIQLIYEELPIFEPMDKTKSEGGRYFRITPRLLGSTGHRYIGGDLLTLWVFRLIKSKLADRILHKIELGNLQPPAKSVLAMILADLPGEFSTDLGGYREGALLEWAYAPGQNLRRYEILNQNLVNPIVPTIFETGGENTAHFFTLWDLSEDAKKRLGTPVSTYTGSGLGQEWLSEVSLDQHQLWRLVVQVHPWLATFLGAEDFKLVLTQDEFRLLVNEPIFESLSLAVNLANARLRMGQNSDTLDRFILSGLSCSMQAVQQNAKIAFQKKEGLFDFNLTTVFFEPELAKTSVAMGACIGRYLQSVRLDPDHEKTRQMLREGYDQIELVVENLFTHLACRLVYDSLVAMVAVFDHGQELNRKSFVDGKRVARTSMEDLRPVQEKFWIYRIDFDGATPQYLGLINAEGIAYQNGFEDFRKFREQYLVGFEVDAELFVRAFFLPRGPKNILALSFLEDKAYSHPMAEALEENNQGYVVLKKAVSSQELFKRRVILPAGTRMVDTIEYPDKTRYRCALSEPLPIREMYDFYSEDLEASSEKEPRLLSHFHLDEAIDDEVTFACDETGRVILLLSTVYDIKIWSDIDYLPQKVDAQYDPFCGQH